MGQKHLSAFPILQAITKSFLLIRVTGELTIVLVMLGMTPHLPQILLVVYSSEGCTKMQ